MTQTPTEGLEEHIGERNNLFQLSSGLNYDHNAQWNSTVDASFSAFFPNESDMTSNYVVSASSNIAVGSTGTGSAVLTFCNGNGAEGVAGDFSDMCVGDSEFHYSFGRRFRYFIF